MAIAYKPAMTAPPISARPPGARSPHELVPVEQRSRVWALAKIVCLLAVTTVGVALAAAIVTGSALFTVLNLG